MCLHRQALLLSRDASVDATDTNGHTALMIAAHNGCSNTVTVLLDAAATVNARCAFIFP